MPKNRDIARRFEREARITARLQHPSIIHVYEAGVWKGGEPFYAMPVVQGRSLDKVVAEKKTLAERLALPPHVIAVADALAYAHNADVIHRDLKPANVLVGEYGETVVIDWGLAKDLGATTDPKESMRLALRGDPEQTASGSVVGTPAYMPPEQARGEAVDQRADVYALGALLYKVLSGSAPYQGSSAQEVIAQVKAGRRCRSASASRVHPPISSRSSPRRWRAIRTTATSPHRSSRRTSSGSRPDSSSARTTTPPGSSCAAGCAAISCQWRSAASPQRRSRSSVRSASRTSSRRAIAPRPAGSRCSRSADAASCSPAILTVRFDPFGIRAAAGADDGSGCVWDTFTGEEVTPLRGHTAAIEAIRWSPDGGWVATANEDGTARVWSPVWGKSLVTPMQHGHRVEALEVSGDGSLLVTGDADGGVWTWRMPARLPNGDDGTMVPVRQSTQLVRHTNRIVAIAFSDTDDLVATAGDDRIVSVWDARTGSPVATFEHAAPVTSIAFAGGLLVTGGSDGTSRVWAPRVVEARPHLIDSPVHALAVSARGVVAAARDDSIVELVAPAPATLQGHTGSVYAAAFTPDGATLVTAGEDAAPIAWNVATHTPRPLQEARGPYRAIAMSPDGDHFGTVRRAAPGEVRLWSLRTGTSIALDAAGQNIDAVAYSPDGDVLVGGADALVVWDANGTRIAKQPAMPITAIPLLARVFLEAACQQAGKPVKTITPSAMEVLLRYPWPGNVRQLRYAMDYAAIAAPDDTIEPVDLPADLGGTTEPPAAQPAVRAAETKRTFRPIAEELEELERRRMAEALEAAGGVKTRAAELIGMAIRTFTLEFKQYKL